VPRKTAGIKAEASFDGLGLRGNDSGAVGADGAVVPEKNLLGADGAGFKYMLEVVLPTFNVCLAGVAVGLMEAATAATAAHAGGARFDHLQSRLCELPTIRAYIARMQIKTDMARALLLDTLTAMETGRADAVLRVLESKAAAGEAATEVLDLAMRVCGGAAFRRDVGVERLFRDARAGTVMAPTTDQLYDFIGKAACGMDLF
jgi:alkylation response protein AidB-like acyl-CoA dehydrogenase